VRLDVVGGDAQPGQTELLRGAAQRLGVADRTTFLGPIEFGPTLFDLYRRSDIHVISSHWEGLPRCLAEARASSLPSVATRVGSLPAAIRDGEDGLLVLPGDPAELAAAIARLIDDAPLRQRIIRGGLTLVPQSTAEFHAGRLAQAIAAALDVAADSRSHPDPCESR